MCVVALRRKGGLNAQDTEAGVLSEVFSPAELQDMVALCDYIVMATPYTEQTHKLFSAELIAAMKPNAVFVNVGRGKCVDEHALITALQQGAFATGAMVLCGAEIVKCCMATAPVCQACRRSGLFNPPWCTGCGMWLSGVYVLR